MNISETVSYDKEGRIDKFPLFKKLFLPVTIILVAGLSFGIGRLSVVSSKEPIKIEYDESLSTKSEASNPKQIPSTNVQKDRTASVSNAIENSKLKTENSASVVVSKNGTKYHYTYCGSAKTIKAENKITFPTASAAEAAGYTLAANCKPK